MAGALSFDLVTTETGLLAIRQDWLALFEATVHPSPFIDYDWVLMVWRRLVHDGGTPTVATIREEGRLVMALPLERQRWHFILHHYLGGRSSMPARDDALLAQDGDAAAWTAALVSGLASNPLSIGLRLESVLQDTRLGMLLAASEVKRAPYSVVSLDGDYTDYIAGFTAMTRQSDRRAQRRLRPGGAVPLRQGTAETLDADLDWLFARKRDWQPPGGELRKWLADPDYEREVRTLVHGWLGRDLARLFFVDAPDGTPAAGCLAFVSGRTSIWYLVTYDPRFSRVSPGRMLALKVIEQLFTDGYELVDFMGGRWEWKDRLKTADRWALTIVAGRPWWYRLIRRLARRG